MYKQLPGNMVTGIVDNFKTTFNKDNFLNYWNPNTSYTELKDYSKSAIQTGVTIYGGVKVGQVVYNKVTTIVKNYNLINTKIDVSNLNYSNTSMKHFFERPYMKYNTVIEEIMKAQNPIIDPKAPASLKWDVSGSWNNSIGNWELIINPKTNTIYHFLFNSHK